MEFVVGDCTPTVNEPSCSFVVSISGSCLNRKGVCALGVPTGVMYITEFMLTRVFFMVISFWYEFISAIPAEELAIISVGETASAGCTRLRLSFVKVPEPDETTSPV